jgi:HK97 family phage prohead protease
MDRKAFRFEVKQLEADGTFAGFASVFGNRDLVNDVVDKGAFAKSLAEAVAAAEKRGTNVLFPFLWQHDTHEPVGGITLAVEEPKGLAVEGFIDIDIPEGKRAYSAMKKGIVRGFSIGYDTIVSEYDSDRDVRRLKELRLWEVSLVTFPANSEAGMTAIKAATSLEVALCAAIGAAGEVTEDELAENTRELAVRAIEAIKSLPGVSDIAPAADDQDAPPALSHEAVTPEDRKAVDDSFAQILAGIRTAAN